MKNIQWLYRFTTFALVIMLLLNSCAFALYDVEHSVIVGGEDKATYPFPSATDEDYTDKALYEAGKFTIGEKDFILLDKDSQGNYFVATADTYGRYRYYADDLTASFGAKKPLVTATKTDEIWTIDDSNAKTFVTEQATEEWTYSTTNEKSIGYWLNNEFLTDGNTTGGVNYKLPDEIQKHLVAKTWEVESVKPLRKITANDATRAIEAGTDVMKLKDLRAMEMAGYTTEEAKVALLSYSEYVKYWEKLGCTMHGASSTVWKNGILFRTPSLRVENDANGYVMTRGVVGIVGQTISDTTKTQTGILAFRTSDDQTSQSTYYVRPVFWLDKDFFAKQKPNISGAGAEVKNEIAEAIEELKSEYKRNPQEVLERYTEDELMDIGIIPGPVGSTGGTMPWIEGDYIDRPIYAEGKFTVGGKEFILLDTDIDGNFFVSTADMYGKYRYHKKDAQTEVTIGALLPLVTATKSQGSDVFDTFDNSNVATAMSDAQKDWFFSTTNQDSIGYWLNNEFLANGNGEDYILPDAIKDNLVEKEWEIEAIKPLFKSSEQGAVTAIENAEDETDGVTKKSELVKLKSKAYTVQGKISLLSYTEYENYWEKLGYTSVNSGGAILETADTDGVLFRTPAVRLECSDTGYVLRRGSFGMVKQGNYYTVDGGKGKGRQIGILAFRNSYKSTSHYNVRPVFYLDKDFFKTVKLENIDNVGEDVKAVIKHTCKIYELSEPYDESELVTLGYDLTEYPKASNTVINGTPTVGSLITVDYDYVSGIGKGEKNTKYVWYTKADDKSETVIAETELPKLIVTSDLKGEKIYVKVYPCDTAGNEGLVSVAETSRAVSDVKGVKLEAITATKTEVNATVRNDSTVDEEIRCFVAVFDSRNILVTLITEPVQTVKAGERGIINITSIPTSQDYTMQFMIWGSDNKPIYFVNK